ncbi:hypothetical protein MRX96_002626 [Rhipicephalus microplus]
MLPFPLVESPSLLGLTQAVTGLPVPAFARARLRSSPLFSFSDAPEWLPWLQQFEDDAFATGMHAAPDEIVNLCSTIAKEAVWWPIMENPTETMVENCPPLHHHVSLVSRATASYGCA